MSDIESLIAKNADDIADLTEVVNYEKDKRIRLTIVVFVSLMGITLPSLILTLIALSGGV